MSNLVLICITCMVCSFFLWLTIRRAVLSVQERDVIAEVKQMYYQDRMALSCLNEALACFNKINEQYASNLNNAVNYHYRYMFNTGNKEPVFYENLVKTLKRYENKIKKLDKLWNEE